MTNETQRSEQAAGGVPLACPYCGAHPETDDGETGGTVECMNRECGVHPAVFFDHEDDANGLTAAIAAWNTRSSPDEAAGWVACSLRTPALTKERTFYDGRASEACLVLYPDSSDSPPGMGIGVAYFVQYEETDGEWFSPIDSHGGLDRCASHGSQAPIAWMPLPAPLPKPPAGQRGCE